MAGGVLLLLMGGLTAMTLPAAAADTGALRQVACWFKVPSSQTAICYRLAVPESRAAAGSAPGSAVKHEVGGGAGKSRVPPDMMLDLPIVVISTPGDRQHDDPIVYLSGGPGDGDWVDADRIGYWWRFLADNPWMRHRDLILFDQRGVGLTAPRADCPEIAALGLAGLALGNDHQRAVDAVATGRA